MKQILLPILFLLSAVSVVAQEADKPGWVTTLPKSENSTYVFVRENGSGSTPGEALNRAMARVFQSTMMRIGTTVSWDEVNKSLQGGADWGAVAMQFNIPVNKVCEYMRKTNNGFVATVLCMVATSGNVYPVFSEFTACNDINTYDNTTALIKSAIMPGLGQMGKNRVANGVFTLVGEVALIGTGVASYSMAKSKLDIMKDNTTSISDFNAAKKSYNTLRTINIASFSAAAALYAFNLYRAYSMSPKYKKDDGALSFYPAITPVGDEAAAGFGLTLNF